MDMCKLYCVKDAGSDLGDRLWRNLHCLLTDVEM